MAVYWWRITGVYQFMSCFLNLFHDSSKCVLLLICFITQKNDYKMYENKINLKLSGQ